MIERYITDARAAIGTAAATISTGTASWLDLIPDNIGKLATLLGIILTSILIATHTYKLKRDRDLHIKKMQLLEIELVKAAQKTRDEQC